MSQSKSLQALPKEKHFGFDEDEIFQMVKKIMLSLMMVRGHYGNHVSNSLINI